MATTTPNFGWSVPTSSDLVKNGATAIETLGDSIDASLVDLKGGTTGQVLAKTTGTDMDFTWTTPSSIGSWTAFTPSRSNITVGNGTEVARYQKVGKTTNVFYQLTLGSTSSIGNTPSISTPSTSAQSVFYSGFVMMQDTGNTSYFGAVLIISGTAYPQAQVANGTYTNAANVTSTVPFTWNSTDVLVMQFSYEES
jgi:hypothetical protein